VNTEDLNVSGDGHILTIELNRPPTNYFDESLIRQLADTLHDAGPYRAVVLCAAGKHFCAGANFGNRSTEDGVRTTGPGLYREAVRLFQTPLPIVAAVQGAAVGGGLGLACMADFRVATPQTRFLANFSRLGFHHGFALSVTLPEIVGRQAAAEMLYTSAKVDGARALAIGLADRVVPADNLRAAATAFALEIAAAAPLAVASIRSTLRAGLVDRVRAAVEHELAEQNRLTQTADWTEGIRASLERRDPVFEGR
jgi:enoyl-CoA hydratase/carnithine racemase